MILNNWFSSIKQLESLKKVIDDQVSGLAFFKDVDELEKYFETNPLSKLNYDPELSTMGSIQETLNKGVEQFEFFPAKEYIVISEDLIDILSRDRIKDYLRTEKQIPPLYTKINELNSFHYKTSFKEYEHNWIDCPAYISSARSLGKLSYQIGSEIKEILLDYAIDSNDLKISYLNHFKKNYDAACSLVNKMNIIP